MSDRPASQERLLVLMPTRRDAERTVAGLLAYGITCEPCRDLQHLCAEIKHGAAAALMAEEAILADGEDCLGETLRHEPSWSNFPVIVLTPQGRDPRHLPASQHLNLTLVERPVRFVTLRSVVDAALRHRRHQYQIRDAWADLTQAREDLVKANRELEERVQERTRKLEESISELEAFSYTISHDLRAPLRSMEGYTRALMQDHAASLNDEGKLFLAKISDSAARLDLMVQDVLAYSRVAKGHIIMQNVSLGEIVHAVIETYPQLRDIHAFHVSKPLPSVHGHPAYLTQCVSNLLGNAVKFARPGVPPKVLIRAEDQPGENTVRVWFEDNGIGIPSEHFKEIFEIFGRGTAGKNYEGTGIGLAIVKKAVERMGGSIGLESEVGRGTRFWLCLRKAL